MIWGDLMKAILTLCVATVGLSLSVSPAHAKDYATLAPSAQAHHVVYSVQRQAVPTRRIVREARYEVPRAVMVNGVYQMSDTVARTQVVKADTRTPIRRVVRRDMPNLYASNTTGRSGMPVLFDEAAARAR